MKKKKPEKCGACFSPPMRHAHNVKKIPSGPEKVLTAPVDERRRVARRKMPTVEVVACKHPGPEQVFRPHICKAPFSVHATYILGGILFGLIMFSWGYGPQWYQLAGDHVMGEGHIQVWTSSTTH